MIALGSMFISSVRFTTLALHFDHYQRTHHSSVVSNNDLSPDSCPICNNVSFDCNGCLRRHMIKRHRSCVSCPITLDGQPVAYRQFDGDISLVQHLTDRRLLDKHQFWSHPHLLMYCPWGCGVVSLVHEFRTHLLRHHRACFDCTTVRRGGLDHHCTWQQVAYRSFDTLTELANHLTDEKLLHRHKWFCPPCQACYKKEYRACPCRLPFAFEGCCANMRCPFMCDLSFVNWESFRSHLFRKHLACHKCLIYYEQCDEETSVYFGFLVQVAFRVFDSQLDFLQHFCNTNSPCNRWLIEGCTVCQNLPIDFWKYGHYRTHLINDHRQCPYCIPHNFFAVGRNFVFDLPQFVSRAAIRGHIKRRHTVQCGCCPRRGTIRFQPMVPTEVETLNGPHICPSVVPLDFVPSSGVALAHRFFSPVTSDRSAVQKEPVDYKSRRRSGSFSDDNPPPKKVSKVGENTKGKIRYINK